MQNLDTGRTSDVSKGIDDEENNWESKDMATAEEVFTTCIRGTMREFKRVCEDAGETVLATIVNVIDQASESIEVKHKNATMSERKTDSEAQPGATLAAERTMRRQITSGGDFLEALKTQLAVALLALENVADE